MALAALWLPNLALATSRTDLQPGGGPGVQSKDSKSKGPDPVKVARLNGDFHLLDRGGRPLVRLDPEIDGTYHDGKRKRRYQRSIEGWRRVRTSSGWQLIAQASTPYSDWLITWLGDDQRPSLELRVEVTYRRPIAVISEALRFQVHPPRSKKSHGFVLDRGFTWRRIDSTFHVGAWTPQIAVFGKGPETLTIRGRAQSMVTRPTRRGYELQLDVDDARNHPLSIFRRCWPRYAKFQEGQRVDKSAQWRSAGERRLVEGTFHVGALRPVEKRRYPEGFQSALVITDHADQSDLARLSALMYGRGRYRPPHAPAKSRRGFASHGLGMSKSVYARGGAFKQLDSKAYRALVQRLVKDSEGRIEIGPHSTRAQRTDRRAVEEDLKGFQQLASSRFWIDHQPSTNCEAISNQGANENTDYYITDLLGDFGYDYVWTGKDVRRPRASLNLFDPKRRGSAHPVLFRHNRISGKRRSLWLFASVWGAQPFGRVLRNYGAKRLDALTREHGLHIAHTYLDSYMPRGNLERWTLLERVKGGFRLKDEADALFKELARRQAAKEIWVAGIVATADHLVGMSQVKLSYQPDGSLRVHNRGQRGLKGATFKIQAGFGQPWLNGRPLPKTQTRSLSKRALWFWFDLEPGETAVLDLRQADGSVRPLLQPGASRLLWTEEQPLAGTR